MPAIVLVRFTYSCSEEELAGLARQFVDEVRPHTEGLVWKIFLHRPDERRTGGVYHFRDLASARAYTQGEFVKQLGQAPIVSDVSVEIFETMEELSRQTDAPL